MFLFAKAQAASFIASVVDYALTILLVEVCSWWYLLGTSIGTVAGGLVNFTLGRRWVFRGGEAEKRVQLFRYFLVWSGYLLLATGGVYALTHWGGVRYLVSKIAVTLFLAVAYNYPLQKHFVFR